GTRFAKVTRPGSILKPGMRCRKDYCRHRYSSAQAWNADQSLLVIVNGCDGLCFLDGQTYEPLFRRNEPGACEWHTLDPDTMICILNDAIVDWKPRSNRFTVIWKSDAYTQLRFGPGKGNLSRDGKSIAIRARQSPGETVAFAFDIAGRKKYPDINLDRLSGKNSYVSISPTGRYIFVFQKQVERVQQAYVFAIDGRLIQHWPEHHRPGHGDMTIDENGDEVFVGISKSEPDKYHVIKRRLEDGKVTVLAPYGSGSHVSARNINRKGWVFVSYGGTYEKLVGRRNRAPFYQEVIALRIDGSGQVRRIAHTRSAAHNYRSETHASASPDGSQVIWSSNWGLAGGPVADFVSRVDWSDHRTIRSLRTE
ncbi:MAG: hypothetical protein OER56_08520, partial [Hyphomicrobiales bacterium]|nr:hypothetical protein [Hyphomicrobiales bacterium]